MPCLSELEMLRDETIAQRARITELEAQLANARAAARIAGAELRAILAGCGDVEEQMRASIAYQPVVAALAEVRAVPERRSPAAKLELVK